jgi:hypothetical protein
LACRNRATCQPRGPWWSAEKGEARHRAEILASRGWLPPPLLHDEIPGWLLAQCERQNALGDATPPAALRD